MIIFRPTHKRTEGRAPVRGKKDEGGSVSENYDCEVASASTQIDNSLLGNLRKIRPYVIMSD